MGKLFGSSHFNAIVASRMRLHTFVVSSFMSAPAEASVSPSFLASLIASSLLALVVSVAATLLLLAHRRRCSAADDNALCVDHESSGLSAAEFAPMERCWQSITSLFPQRKSCITRTLIFLSCLLIASSADCSGSVTSLLVDARSGVVVVNLR